LNFTEISRQIEEGRKKGDYRPVVVAVMRNEFGEILVVQSVHNHNEWMFPQGGVESEEHFLESIFREVKEEIGIEKSRLMLVDYLGSRKIDAPEDRKNKREFTKGKDYHFFQLGVVGREVCLNSKELSGYSWTSTEEEVTWLLSKTRGEKREMMLRFISHMW